MRRLGIVDHVSRFDQRHGYREGWVFSGRFTKSLRMLADFTVKHEECVSSAQRQKDFDVFRYL